MKKLTYRNVISKILIMLLAFMLLFSITACGDDKTEGTEDVPPVTGGEGDVDENKITITGEQYLQKIQSSNFTVNVTTSFKDMPGMEIADETLTLQEKDNVSFSTSQTVEVVNSKKRYATGTTTISGIGENHFMKLNNSYLKSGESSYIEYVDTTISNANAFTKNNGCWGTCLGLSDVSKLIPVLDYSSFTYDEANHTLTLKESGLPENCKKLVIEILSNDSAKHTVELDYGTAVGNFSKIGTTIIDDSKVEKPHPKGYSPTGTPITGQQFLDKYNQRHKIEMSERNLTIALIGQLNDSATSAKSYYPPFLGFDICLSTAREHDEVFQGNVLTMIKPEKEGYTVLNAGLNNLYGVYRGDESNNYSIVNGVNSDFSDVEFVADFCEFAYLPLPDSTTPIIDDEKHTITYSYTKYGTLTYVLTITGENSAIGELNFYEDGLYINCTTFIYNIGTTVNPAQQVKLH